MKERYRSRNQLLQLKQSTYITQGNFSERQPLEVSAVFSQESHWAIFITASKLWQGFYFGNLWLSDSNPVEEIFAPRAENDHFLSLCKF